MNEYDVKKPLDPPVVRQQPGAGRKNVDVVDQQILQALRANARATFAELGRLVGLSAPAVHERVRRLEDAAVIRGYHADVAPGAVGLGVTALVGVLQTDDSEQDEVADRLREVPEVEDCWFVAGEESFVVKVRVPDVDALEHTLAVLRRLPGIARTRTTVVLSTRWEGRVPLPQPSSTAADADAGDAEGAERIDEPGGAGPAGGARDAEADATAHAASR
jgi:Lrp/AsnC family leucine-responsive transcriptional regulator